MGYEPIPQRISKQIAEAVTRIWDVVGAVIISYAYSPELAIPILRFPEFSQVPERDVWEAITFMVGKRSFEDAFPPNETDSNPTCQMFQYQILGKRYSTVGCNFTISMADEDHHQEYDPVGMCWEYMKKEEQFSIRCFLRKGKTDFLLTSEMDRALQTELKIIINLMQNSKDVEDVLMRFHDARYTGMTNTDAPAYEPMMVRHHIEMLHHYLGNEPMAPWMRLREILANKHYKGQYMGALSGMYQMRTGILEDQDIT